MKSLLTLCLLGFAFVVGCADKIVVPPGTTSGAGKIVYTAFDFSGPSNSNDNYPIVTIDTDGRNSHTIAQGVAVGAANGKILYVTTAGGSTPRVQFVLCNSDGSGAQVVRELDTSEELSGFPALSPNAGYLAYRNRYTPDSSEVVLITIPTGQRKVVERILSSETSIAFSSDSRNLVYYNASWLMPVGYLRMASTDGPSIRTLTTIKYPGVDGIAGIAWRPNSNQVAYFDSNAIYIINGDGSGRQLISQGATFAWSPNGQALAFASGGMNGNGTASIFVTNDLGLTRTNLTGTSNSFEAYPIWSADGKRIFALSWIGDYDHTTQNLISIDVATKAHRVLASPAQFLYSMN